MARDRTAQPSTGAADLAHQVGQPALARQNRQGIEVGGQHLVAALHDMGEHPLARAVQQFVAPAVLDQREMRCNPGLQREAAEQGLAETVDRGDLQATGSIQHQGEEVTRAGMLLRRGGPAHQRGEIGLQGIVVECQPDRQLLAHADRHFGRGRLGEGQAQDAFGRRTAEQQAQYPVGQHLGLSGAGRGRDPDCPLRVRHALLAVVAAARLMRARAVGRRRQVRHHDVGTQAPFAGARDIAVGVVAPYGRAAGMVEIGLCGLGKGRDQPLQARQRGIGDILGGHVARLGVAAQPRGLAARELPVGNLGDRCGGDLGKGALAHHRRLQGKLRRAAAGDGLVAGHRAGLVVDDVDRAVVVDLQPVGLGDEGEGAQTFLLERKPAPAFGMDIGQPLPSLTLDPDEPCRDTLEAAPPQGTDRRAIERAFHRLVADGDQLVIGVVRQVLGVLFDEGL